MLSTQSVKTSMPENEIQQLHLPGPLRLGSGAVLDDVTIAYQTFGRLNPEGDNAIWVFHALTANSNPLEWWPGLFGTGCLFNPEEHFIICANMPGSCYGSTGAAAINPSTGRKFGKDFPVITIGDIVTGLQELRKRLGIGKFKCGIGGSMGGQQLLELAVREPDLFDLIIPIATNAFHSPYGIAFNTAQRMAIEADPTFSDYEADSGKSGLEAARAIGMLSYRTRKTFEATQSDNDMRPDGFSSDSYQRYQGQKLSKRFDAHAYYILTKAMDSHHLGRAYGSAEAALRRIKSSVLAIGINSDLLFPVEEQEFIARNCIQGKLATLDSLYGHDGFLIETEKLTNIIRPVLQQVTV